MFRNLAQFWVQHSLLHHQCLLSRSGLMNCKNQQIPYMYSLHNLPLIFYIKSYIHHWKDNSPKPVNHSLTLKWRPKVKSVNIRRFPAYDILQVGFTMQISRTNNKGDVGTFKVCYVGYFGTPLMTLN